MKNVLENDARRGASGRIPGVNVLLLVEEASSTSEESVLMELEEILDVQERIKDPGNVTLRTVLFGLRGNHGVCAAHPVVLESELM